MKKNKFSKNWIIKQKRDIYVKQSKIEGYRSRAVYKLKEINDKFKFLKSGIQLVDLVRHQAVGRSLYQKISKIQKLSLLILKK